MVKQASDARLWPVWQLPPAFKVLYFSVVGAAITSFFPLSAPSASQLGRFVELAVLGLATITACVRMEKVRTLLDQAKVPDLAAVWTFAGALCLDHMLAILLVVVIYVGLWPGKRQVYVGHQYKWLFNLCNIALAVRLAQFGSNAFESGVILFGANVALISAAFITRGQSRELRKLVNAREQLSECATLLLGFATAVALSCHLALGVLSIAATLLVQYASMRRSLARPATIDPETGLLTARAWNAFAQLQLARNSEALVIHVSLESLGDRSIGEAAKLLRSSVRPEDLAGRTTDGFCLLVASPGGRLLADALTAQMEYRFALAGITAATGVAVTPELGETIDINGLAVSASAEAIVKSLHLSV